MTENTASLVEEMRRELTAVNIVSFSGGKDSTVVLQLLLEAIRDTGQKLYIVTADTLMEIPYFQSYVERTKRMVVSHVDTSGINAEVVTVFPKLQDSFWTSVLGKGYPAAHMGFRWCTGKLKIDPISNFVRSVTKGEEYTAFLGVRRAESTLRAKIYTRKDYKPHHYAPILDWTSHDVWEFLLTQPCPWNYSEGHAELVTVYRYSSDECVYGEKQGVCVGNARYGCWACPLQKDSQLDMIGFHTGETEKYHKLRDFKRLLVGAANKTGYRSRIRRNGEVGTGPFLVSVRKYLYEKLKDTEQATGFSLITPKEEGFIRMHWEKDQDIHCHQDRTQLLLWNFEGGAA